MPTPDGIAVDWIADHIYWTEADTKKIEVARLDGSFRRVVISKDLMNPRAIVVYPQKGSVIVCFKHVLYIFQVLVYKAFFESSFIFRGL